MTDEELIARLRDAKRDWPEFGHDRAEAAARIEALTEQLAAARQDAHDAEDELELQEQEACMMENGYIKLEKERDALEAKLAKAVEIGNKMAHSIEGNYYLPNIAGEWRKVAAEIKGESHE
jgi:chromosome segregation ATPase